jgi:hypothetical protein
VTAVVVAGVTTVAWLATSDPEGRAQRERAVEKLAAKSKSRLPAMRAVGRNGTIFELSTKGLADCHAEAISKTLGSLTSPSAEGEGVVAPTDPSRVYVVTPEGDLGTALRDELPSLRRRAFSLASREMVAEAKATLECGDPTAKCSQRWLEEMATTYSSGDVGQLMAALGFARIACVGDDWEGSLPLKR